jgi:hypothetical protein
MSGRKAVPVVSLPCDSWPGVTSRRLAAGRQLQRLAPRRRFPRSSPSCCPPACTPPLAGQPQAASALPLATSPRHFILSSESPEPVAQPLYRTAYPLCDSLRRLSTTPAHSSLSFLDRASHSRYRLRFNRFSSKESSCQLLSMQFMLLHRTQEMPRYVLATVQQMSPTRICELNSWL